MMLPSFQGARTSGDPFPHMRVPAILRHEDADRVLCWLREAAPWTLTVESFYEQYEFSLLATTLESELDRLVAPDFVGTITAVLSDRFQVAADLDLVDVSAHKLTRGQTIRIHNDYLGAEETHRLLIQLNSGWEAEQGGLLMLFESDRPESLRSVVLPTHASGFAFEICPRSFHVVSSIKTGERYTLVYTFRRRH